MRRAAILIAMSTGGSISAIAGRLAREVRGEVWTDEPHRTAYSTAACIYRVRPAVVVCPQDAADVAAAARLAGEEGLPVTARGAGTAVTGSALGAGIVLDFARHMRAVFPPRPDEGAVRIQPGVVLADLNAALARVDSMIGPDPSSEKMCTVGGMIACNASGARGLRYGATADHVRSLDLVLADGSFARVGPAGAALGRSLERIRHETAELLLARRAEIQARAPATRKNTAGYDLRGATAGGALDLVRLLAGSEGTLALVVEATLGTVPRPPARASLALFFHGLAAAGEAVQPLVEAGASAVEILGDAFLALARRDGRLAAAFVPDGAGACLLVEFLGERGENEERCRRARRAVVEGLGLAFASHESADPAEQEKLWEIRTQAVQTLARIDGPGRPVPFVEDTVVPPGRLVEYMGALAGLFERHGVRAAIYGHAGEGNVHVRPVLDLDDPRGVDRMRSIAGEVADLVLSLGGSVSGEHGDGRLRSGYLRRQYGDIYSLFEGVKRIWDPRGILNPGVVVTAGEGIRTDSLKRMSVPVQGTPAGPLGGALLAAEVERCAGCGACRSVCPVFRIVADEALSPRGRVNLAGARLAGERPRSRSEAGLLTAALRSCMGCRRCLAACPSGTDVPLVVAGASAQLRPGVTIRAMDRLLADPPLLARAAAPVRPVVNWLAGRRAVRRIVPGLATGERPPRLARPLVLDAVPGRAPAGTKVVYYPGCHARFHGPETARRIAALLGDLFGDVIVAGGGCCGMPALAAGDIEGARRRMEETAKEIAPLLAEDGVLASGCPSCVLAFRHDYPLHLGGERAERMSRAARGASELLLDRAADLRARAGPSPIAYHSPCHARVRGEDPDLALLRALGIEPVVANTDCCGMAGAWGLKRENEALSARISDPVLDRLKASGARAIVTGCGMCGERLGGGTGLPVLHAIDLVAVPP